MQGKGSPLYYHFGSKCQRISWFVSDLQKGDSGGLPSLWGKCTCAPLTYRFALVSLAPLLALWRKEKL